MRGSLVIAALMISLVACKAADPTSAKNDWQCAPTPVHNGETVTCTTSAKAPPAVAAQDPQAPSGGGEIYVRTYAVPASDYTPTSSDTNTNTSGGGAGGSDESDVDDSNATNPGAPSSPDEYDCSVNGESCPPADVLPPASAPAPSSSGSAPGGTTGSPVDSTATDYRCKTADTGTTCTRKTIDCKPGTMQVGNECVAPGETPSTPSPSGGGCTLTQGYWKNHASQWPTQVLSIGGVSYTQSELLAIFNTPPGGDASLILGHQLIAAMLNAANGAGQAQVGSAIQAAQDWMSANVDADGRLPYGVASACAAGTDAVSISTTLDTYNNGGLGTPHCK